MREEIPGKRLRCLLGTRSYPLCSWPSDMSSPMLCMAFAAPCAAFCFPEAETSLGGVTVVGQYRKGTAVMEHHWAAARLAEAATAADRQGGPGMLRIVLVVMIVGCVLTGWFLLRGYRRKDD
ncbi:hypothetical protein GCM10010384_16210 [Streptomyces djakartensis]|uniref:Uncharacterized protein n=2 Tax=Streptomyces djakartensis TaxID=68193 RepID=A0ABQ2ZDT7_9ACTN|nr:hypothetical protein GCM10010384_16210 [Streptomyces djakartensis]